MLLRRGHFVALHMWCDFRKTIILGFSFDALFGFRYLCRRFAWDRQWCIVFSTFHVARSSTRLVGVVFGFDMTGLSCRLLEVMFRFVAVCRSRPLVKLSLVAKEVGNITLIFSTVDGYQERWRVISYFPDILVNRIAFQLSFVWLQEGL